MISGLPQRNAISSFFRLIQNALVAHVRRTSELTRRREFIQASPDQSSYETRSRRSRPTICWAALETNRTLGLDRLFAPVAVHDFHEVVFVPIGTKLNASRLGIVGKTKRRAVLRHRQ